MVKKVSRLHTTEEIMAMVKALRGETGLNIEETGETVIVKIENDGRELFRALKKGTANTWITKYPEKLFTRVI